MKFEADIVCKSCGGTGLYVGMAERNGAAVICGSCNGTGCYHYSFEYKPFTERKIRGDVKRVFKGSFGYVHSAEDTNGIPFSKSGVGYLEWLGGKQPGPIKTLYCPLSWTGQEWSPKWCGDCMGFSGYISNCKKKLDGSMTECWDAYDERNK